MSMSRSRSSSDCGGCGGDSRVTDTNIINETYDQAANMLQISCQTSL